MKFLKSLFIGATVIVMSLTAHAQFSGPGGNSRDLLNNTPLTITTAGISNLTVYVKPTQNGFSIAPYFVATNASLTNIAFYATPIVPLPSGSSTGTAVGSASLLGTVAANGTTAVAGYINITSNYNVVAIRIGISNTHSSSIVVSNLFYTVY